jgi:hypothetical protein
MASDCGWPGCCPRLGAPRSPGDRARGAATAAATSAWAARPRSGRAGSSPPSPSSPFVVGAAAKQGGEHQPKDLPQQVPYRVQSPLDRRRPRLWQTQVDQCLFQGGPRALCASGLALEVLAVRLKAAVLRRVLSSLGMCSGRHGLLRCCMVACVDETMAHSVRPFKNFQVAPCRFALWTRPRGQTGIARYNLVALSWA